MPCYEKREETNFSPVGVKRGVLGREMCSFLWAEAGLQSFLKRFLSLRYLLVLSPADTWVVLQFRMLLIMQVMTCRIWLHCASELPPFLCAWQNTQQYFPLHFKTLGEMLKMQMPWGFVMWIYQVEMKIILSSFLKTFFSNVNNNLRQFFNVWSIFSCSSLLFPILSFVVFCGYDGECESSL